MVKGDGWGECPSVVSVTNSNVVEIGYVLYLIDIRSLICPPVPRCILILRGHMTFHWKDVTSAFGYLWCIRRCNKGRQDLVGYRGLVIVEFCNPCLIRQFHYLLIVVELSVTISEHSARAILIRTFHQHSRHIVVRDNFACVDKWSRSVRP